MPAISGDAWMYPASLSGDSDYEGIVINQANNAYFGVDPSGYLKLSLIGNGGYVSSAGTVSLNAWVRVSYTCDGTKENIYINGRLDNSITVACSVGNNNRYWGTGAQLDQISGGPYGAPYNRRFAGNMANVQIYNTSLSAVEIRGVYAEGIGGAPARLQNLVAWWPLNGGANGYSGNRNNGIPTSVTYTSSWSGACALH